MKTKKTTKLIISISFIIALSGCSTKSWYETIQQESERNCNKQPSSEISQCLENLNKKSYKEYKKER